MVDMGDLKLVSSFGECGFNNPDFSSGIIVPKFTKRKVPCKREFPVAFDQLREESKLKSEQRRPDTNALSSMKEVEVERDFNYRIGPEIKHSEPMLRSPMAMPKKRRFSAVRDFPDGFKELNGRMGSPQQENVSESAVDDMKPFETVFEHPTSSSDLQLDLFSENLEIRKNTPSLVALELPDKDLGFLSHDFEFDMVEPLISPDQEEDQQLVPESVGSFTKIDGENCDIISQSEGLKESILEDGLYEKLEHKTTTKKMCSGMLPKRRRVSATRDFPVAFLQSNAGCSSVADKDGGYVLLDDEEPFENDMLSLRDEDDCVPEDDKKPFQNYLWPLEEIDSFSNNEELGCKAPLFASSMDEFVDAGFIDQSGIERHRISKVIGYNKNESEQYSGKTFFQSQHLGSEGQEHRVIVQALMASSRCPWRSRIRCSKSEGLKKSK